MTNKMAVIYNPMPMLLNGMKLGVSSQGTYNTMSRKNLPAIVFPETEKNSSANIVFRNVSSNHSILARFVLKSTPYVPPGTETNLGGTIVFPSVKGNHTIQVTFEYKPWPYLDQKTVLLLHFESETHIANSNETRFLDSSSYGHGVDSYPNPLAPPGYELVGYPFKRWGKKGVEFLSYISHNYLYGLRAMDGPEHRLCLESNDFAIDFWITKIGSFGWATNPIFSFSSWKDNKCYELMLHVKVLTAKVYLTANMDGDAELGRSSVLGSTVLLENDWDIYADTWTHVAITRHLGIFKMYVRGVCLPNTSDTVCNFPIPMGPTSFYIGPVSLYMDELRISNGDARWTEDFTPPTGPYSDQIIPELSVQFDLSLGLNTVMDRGEDVRLLLHMDVDPFIDSSPRHHIIDNNNVTCDSLVKKWDSSGYFDGLGSYLSIPNSIDWNFGSGPLTIDFWVVWGELGLQYFYPIFSQGVKNTSNFFGAELSCIFGLLRFNVYVGTSQFVFAQYITDYFLYNGQLNDEFVHFGIVLIEGLLYLYVNGDVCSVYYTGVSIPEIEAPLLVGSDGVNSFKGNIEEFRISRKADVFTSVPIAPYGPPVIPTGIFNMVEADFSLPALMSSVVRGPGEHDILLESPISFAIVPRIDIGSVEFNLPINVDFFTSIVELTPGFVFSNRWKKEILSTYPNTPGVEGDYRVGLMFQSFIFDPDIHEYFDGQVDEYEIPETYGYMSGISMAFKEFSIEGVLSFEDFEFPTANGGRCGPITSVVIYDYASHAQGLIVGCILLSTAITLDGSKIKLSDLSFQIV